MTKKQFTVRFRLISKVTRNLGWREIKKVCVHYDLSFRSIEWDHVPGLIIADLVNAGATPKDFKS